MKRPDLRCKTPLYTSWLGLFDEAVEKDEGEALLSEDTADVLS